jgi:hypothetical protein
MSRPAVSWLTTFLLAAALLSVAASPATQPTPGSGGDVKPDPKYSPQEVVKIQLQAMQHNDDPTPDAGIAVTFRFASPSNQAQTGPLPNFIAMVKSPVYSVMIDHKSANYADIEVKDDQARQLVQLVAADGTTAYFGFILHKQSDGPYKDCWMTDGVARLEPAGGPYVPPPGNNGDGRKRA